MKIIEVENNKYEIIKDYKNGFDEEEFINHYTDFFEDYDYLVGDIAYSKLRLKGFYDEKNKKTTYVTVKGLEKAQEDVAKYSEEAIRIMEELPYENEFLHELILHLIHRNA